MSVTAPPIRGRPTCRLHLRRMYCVECSVKATMTAWIVKRPRASIRVSMRRCQRSIPMRRPCWPVWPVWVICLRKAGRRWTARHRTSTPTANGISMSIRRNWAVPTRVRPRTILSHLQSEKPTAAASRRLARCRRQTVQVTKAMALDRSVGCHRLSVRSGSIPTGGGSASAVHDGRKVLVQPATTVRATSPHGRPIHPGPSVRSPDTAGGTAGPSAERDCPAPPRAFVPATTAAERLSARRDKRIVSTRLDTCVRGRWAGLPASARRRLVPSR